MAFFPIFKCAAKWRLASVRPFIIVVAMLVSGCTMMLPGFDNVLNQDIRHPRVADVVEGVRCAMNSFLRTRQKQVQEKVWAKELERIENNCATDEWWEKVKVKDGSDKGQERGQCVRRTSYLALDDSRFALDPTQKAQVEFTLHASNTGGINFTKISDNVALGPLDYFRASGSATAPFPALNVSARGTNTVAVAISMDQKIPDERDARLALATARAQSKPTGAALAQAKGGAIQANPARTIPTIAKPAALADEYNQICVVEGQGTEDTVDYLAIKKLLIKLVEEQASNIYHGAPDFSLNTLTLTTSFQLTVDASMGTNHLFRIVPVVIPPTARFNPDHIHTLKITLKGGYKKNLPSSWADAKLSCEQRLGLPAGNRYCESPAARQRELLIEELQNSRPTTAQ